MAKMQYHTIGEYQELLRKSGLLFETKTEGSSDQVIRILTYNSKEAGEDTLFICKGAAFKPAYLREAVEKGAVCYISEKAFELEKDIPYILVTDIRKAMAILANFFYQEPWKELVVTGIGGTKGKSTSAYYMKAVVDDYMEAQGKKESAVISSIDIYDGVTKVESHITTPEAMELQQHLRNALDSQITYAEMEVSSQALMLHRTAGFEFDFGIFTNIEPDHIGPNEHRDFQHYLECKSMLLRQCKVGIVNRDDKHFEQIIKGHTCALATFGFSEKADLRAEDAKLVSGKGWLGIDYRVRGMMNFQVEIDIPGKFSIYNSLTAIAICRHFKVSEKDIVNALRVAKVKGRIEMIKVSDEFTLMIDYAHNAMALESLLTTLREYHPHRLVCLFGCGGNRSKLRRYEMGETSGRLADLTIITSDNPRYEKPQAIIDDIKVGISKKDGKYIEIADRKEAIAYAIHHGEPGDIIILAGKGHEDYPEIEGKKYPMDERVLISDILAGR